MGAVRIALLASLLLISCASAAKPASPATGGEGAGAPVGPTGVEPPPAALDISGWRAWPRSNPRRFRSKGHGYLWVDVHVRADDAGAYGERAAAVPPGFVVVMAGFETTDAATPTGLTVMAKMPAGYDPQHGDWYYAIFDPDGKAATLGGQLAPCLGCHVHAPRDFLFGVAPKEEAP